jgi:hypothetical protein
MNRILLSIILLSGLVFLICLVQNSCSSMYSFAMASQIHMPSQTRLLLMGIQSNPWFGISLVSQSVFAISGLVGVIFFLRSKTKYRARRDVA